MIVTERDKKLLRFIEKFRIATTDTIQELFYPSLRVAQNRLRLMTENKLLKREREHFTSQYYYYIKKPTQVRHSLLLTSFYRELTKIAQIEVFEKEFSIEDIRPDGLVAYRYDNKNYIAFVEVQISMQPLDIGKYERLYKSGKYKGYFPVFPLIIAISDKKLPETKLQVIHLDEDLKSINLRV